LRSQTEWFDYSKSDEKPVDIPANPVAVYANAGWRGMGDWLGTGRVANQLLEHQPFKKARAFANGLGLKSASEWLEYCRTGNKPADILAHPDRVYAKAGWLNWGDWLGTGTVAPNLRQYRSFVEARAFAHSLGLKSQAEWPEYCGTGKKPHD